MSDVPGEPLPPGATDELDLLLECSVRHALDEPDGHAFVPWFQEVAPLLAPNFIAGFEGSDAERHSALHMIGRLLWNRIPHPDHRFRPRPLPKPERNAPCPCGSGRKYKQCCARAETFGDPFEDMSLLAYVLDQFSRTRLKTMPLDGIDLDELAHVASEWCDASDRGAADAVVLLERVFADVARADARAEYAFDVLADCYDALGRPQKKADLIERCLAAHDVSLRSAAMHRKITIAADHGQRDVAWHLFAEAQRMDPDHPGLATLEITLLLADGDHDRLRERGRFWMARLARNRDHDYADLIAHIRDLIADPEGAVLKVASRDAPGLIQLRSMLGSLPPVECHYSLAGAHGEAQLLTSSNLVELEAQWRRTVAIAKPDLTLLQTGDDTAAARVAPGIAWLASNPLAWQSFEVLDDLALAVREAGLMGGGAILLDPLLERACALLRLVLEPQGATDCALPWGFLDNRPALRLVASLCYLRLHQERWNDAEELARWLVVTLNPHDNHGLRAELSQLALRRGDGRAALDVCDRFPDDGLVATVFNRVLALFILGRRDEAEVALRGAAAAHRRIVPMLTATAPKRPRDGGPYVTYGSAQEAWLYREACRALWEHAGALDWARDAMRSRGAARPRRSR